MPYFWLFLCHFTTFFLIFYEILCLKPIFHAFYANLQQPISRGNNIGLRTSLQPLATSEPSQNNLRTCQGFQRILIYGNLIKHDLLMEDFSHFFSIIEENLEEFGNVIGKKSKFYEILCQEPIFYAILCFLIIF